MSISKTRLALAASITKIAIVTGFAVLLLTLASSHLCAASIYAIKQNLMQYNPGFEDTNIAYTNMSKVSTSPYAGSYCGRQTYTPWNANWNTTAIPTATPAAQYAYSDNSITNCVPGKQYRLSAWNKNTVSAGDIYIGMQFKDSSDCFIGSGAWKKIPNQNAAPAWQICEMEFTAPPGTVSMTPYFCIDANVTADPVNNTQPDVYWDDIAIEDYNLANNPNFEEDLTSWTNASRISASPRSGNYCITQTYTSGGSPGDWDCAYSYNNAKFIPCSAGEQYYFSVWNRNTVTGGDIKIGMRFVNSAGNSISYSWGQTVKTNFSDWQKCEMVFIVPYDAVKMTTYFKAEYNVMSGEIYWDDITVSLIGTNLGFEQTPTNYTNITLDSANQRSGAYCGKQTYIAGNTWNCAYHNIPYIRCGSNESYCLSVWNKNNVPTSGSTNPDDRISIGVRFVNSSNISIGYTAWQPIPHNSSAWQQCTLEFTTPPGTVAINPYFMIGKNIANDYNIYWDDITITPSAVYASAYGSTHNAATIDAAIQAISSNTKTLILDGSSWSIDDNVTVPSNIILKIVEGTTVSIATGKTLTISGKVNLGPTGKFTGPGTVNIQDTTVAAMPQWWGAIPDNTSIDCAPGIRSALASGAQNIYLPQGTYLVKTLSGNIVSSQEYAFVIPNQMVCFYGDGMNATSIKMDTDVLMPSTAGATTGGAGFYVNNNAAGDNTASVKLKNFMIDMNGYNNLVPAVTPVKACYALRAVNSNNITIEGVGFLNSPGRNYLVFSSTSTLAGNNYIYRTRNNTVRSCVFRNGGTSLAYSDGYDANKNQSDFSHVYMDSSDSVFEQNIILQDHYPFTNNGGLEAHAYNIVCQNNYFSGNDPAAYIWADKVYNSNATEFCGGNKFKYNIMRKCQAGIIMSGSSIGEENRAILKDIEITHNKISLKKFPNSTAIPAWTTTGDNRNGFTDTMCQQAAILMYPSTIVACLLQDSEISYNSMCEDGTEEQPIASNFIATTGLNNVSISYNTVEKATGDAMIFVSSAYQQDSGNPTAMTDVTINNNTIADFGGSSTAYYAIKFTFGMYFKYNSVTGEYEASTSSSDHAYDLPSNVSIQNNTISKVTNPTSSYAFWLSWTGITATWGSVSGNTLNSIQFKAGPRAYDNFPSSY